MQSIKTFLAGKKTYIVGFIVFVLGGLQALHVTIPSEVFSILGGLGLISLRASISNIQ